MDLDRLPQLLTIREACELFRVGRRTIWTWEKAGRLKRHKIGSSQTSPVRFTRESVLALLNNEQPVLNTLEEPSHD